MLVGHAGPGARRAAASRANAGTTVPSQTLVQKLKRRFMKEPVKEWTQDLLQGPSLIF